jgi:hypothetical protein
MPLHLPERFEECDETITQPTIPDHSSSRDLAEEYYLDKIDTVGGDDQTFTARRLQQTVDKDD